MIINTEFLTNNIENVVDKDQKQRSFNDMSPEDATIQAKLSRAVVC